MQVQDKTVLVLRTKKQSRLEIKADFEIKTDFRLYRSKIQSLKFYATKIGSILAYVNSFESKIKKNQVEEGEKLMIVVDYERKSVEN